MARTGRSVLTIALAPVVLMLAAYGTVFAAVATLPWLLLGLALVLSAGGLLGVILRPTPASSRPGAIAAGSVFLGIGTLGLVCAIAFPTASVALRSGLLAPLFSPWGMGLALVLGTALLVARRGEPEYPDQGTLLRHTGSRDPPPE